MQRAPSRVALVLNNELWADIMTTTRTLGYYVLPRDIQRQHNKMNGSE